MTLVVLVPTFRRNASLQRALQSVFAQTLRPDRIVVADNSPEAGAKALIQRLEPQAPCPLIYAHAALPGVANARNAGFAACLNADRVAQLDDDESASPGWLAALDAAATMTGAAVVFGPVHPQAEGAGGVRTAWLTRLYARLPDLADGLIDKPYGCGNSMIVRSACALPDPPFDAAANETGGEDDRLFSQLKERGDRFAWANAAQVREHVDPKRGRWQALARRAFAFGQGPSQDAAERKAWLQVAAWMALGTAQAGVFAALAPVARLAGPAPCAACIDKAVQGAGKLFWADKFAPRFYGEALVSQTS